MSVFKKVTAKALEERVNMKILEDSLKELNLTLDGNTKVVSNAYGHASVDYALVNNGKVTSLGLKANGKGGFSLEGDPFGARIKDRFGETIFDGQHQQVMNAISQLYQKNLMVYNLRRNGWDVKVTNSIKNKKEIVLNCEIL